jgi:hypothetical protein
MPRTTDRSPLAEAIALALLGALATAPVVAAEEGAEGDGAEAAEKSALTFWEGGEGSELKLTVKAAAAYFVQNNSWFGNAKAPQNLGASSGSWWETYIHPGIEGSYALENGSSLYGRVSGVFASTNETDAAGSNIPWGNVTGTRFEDAYAGWRSGDLFGELGKDFIDVSVGRQQYVAGTGFLFFTQSSNGQNRGGYWMGERQAAKFSGIVKLKSGNWKSDLVYFEADDNPNSNTRLGGITLDYTFGEAIGGVGGGIYTLASDIETRDSMNVFDIRFSLFPFEAFEAADVLRPIKIEGEYVHEDNGHLVDDDGWYLSAGYQWAELPWKPTLTYRYASFSESYDPLFYGFYDWGYWYQGEVLGEYVLGNFNLDSHMVKLNVKPLESVSASVFYYKFDFHDAGTAGVKSRDFADEWDLVVDWTATEHVTISAVAAYVSPDKGAEQYTGGDDAWSYGMLYGSVSF